MKIARFIKEEIIPLSSRENLILLIIVSSIFQFALFFTPLLANEAVKQAKAATNDDLVIVSSPVMKSELPDQNLLELIDTAPVVADTTGNTTLQPITKMEPISEPVATSSDNVLRTSTHVITAYNSEPGQTDNSPCITANGFDVCKHGKEDTIAANFLKFGTKVKIPELFGDRVFIVRDRMNKKHPNRVDIWMLDKQAALKFGVKTAKIVVIE